MSLNTAHAMGGVLIFNTERILIYYDGVEMAFDMPGAMSFDMPGALPHFKGNKKGRVYLTTHRVIFNNKDAKDTLQSFSMPFYTLSELELEQPVFGANYIKGKVKAEPNAGNWTGEGRFKMWFNHGGAIEFGQAMLHAGKMASRYFPTQPPAYSNPVDGYYQAPPPAYAPPTGPGYSFVPYQTFPDAPPQNSVYMSHEPPPYPGIDGTAPPPTDTNGYASAAEPTYPPGSAAAAKAAEAARSGEAYPSNATYMPASPPQYQPPGATASAPPPPYSEATKKTD